MDIKNPWLAVILTLLCCGLGQVYNGEVGKGVAFFLACIFIGMTIFILIGIVLLPLWFAYCAYDAYTVAEAINKRGYI